MARQRGVPGIPGMAGAQILQKQPVRTSHETMFRNCRAHLRAVSDGSVIIGYEFSILDMAENHRYAFTFGEDLLLEFTKVINTMPKVGSPVTGPENGDPTEQAE